MDDKELQKQLLAAFRTEARERVQSLFASLAELEKNPDPETRERLIEVVFREAHSLKGAARSVNIQEIEALCQAMEGIFSEFKRAKTVLPPRMLDELHEAARSIENYLDASPDGLPEVRTKMAQLTGLLSKALAEDENRPVSEKKKHQKEPAARETAVQQGLTPKFFSRAALSETVRISTAKLDGLLLKAEELISLKQILNQHLGRMREIGGSLRALKKQWDAITPEMPDIKKAIHRHHFLHRFLEAFESGHQQITKTLREIDDRVKGFEQSNRMLGGMADELLEETKKACLLPFSTLFALLPPMVREIAVAQGKEVDVELVGEEIEIDKQILDNIRDPLIHLLRNAVDHGIENPQVRSQKQKSRRGLIRLIVSQPEHHTVELKVQDDGAGINTQAIVTEAVKQGILSPENARRLKEREIYSLIFHSGISTSPVLSEISGRGLGMAIVKDGIETLGGSISIDSASDRGTVFTIHLPVTLATFRGILVSVSGHFFLIPNTYVVQALKINQDDIKTAENRTIITLAKRPLSLVDLADTLGLQKKPAVSGQRKKTKNPSLPAVVLEHNHTQTAFIVDEILNEQEVLVKNLGSQLKRIPNIAGATVLGSGRVVPVLCVKDLIQSVVLKPLPAVAPEPLDREAEKVKSILVVEDSLTARTLLKNILEASGYLVKTAVNGEDGFNQLKAKAFDAVVSDIEMPRMNGFELTQKIRKDPSLADTPVVLVTNLDSPVDRERGIDAGADAYIVKSHFDRSNLLEVIARLV